MAQVQPKLIKKERSNEHTITQCLVPDPYTEWRQADRRQHGVGGHAARQAAQAEVAELKERIARAGVEHRRAVREAVLEEREACAQVLGAALKVVSDALNDLVEACHGHDGKLKAPDKKELMRARSMLPPRCSYTLTKKISTH